MASTNPGEQEPLLGDPDVQNLARNPEFYNDLRAKREAAAKRAAAIRATLYGSLTVLFAVALVGMLFFWEKLGGVIGGLPKDPDLAALIIMNSSPAIVSVPPIRSGDTPSYLRIFALGWTYWYVFSSCV